MLGVLLAFGILAVLGAVIPALSPEVTYGSKLEEYIVSNNPKNAGDVERLTREFSEKQKQGIV